MNHPKLFHRLRIKSRIIGSTSGIHLDILGRAVRRGRSAAGQMTAGAFAVRPVQPRSRACPGRAAAERSIRRAVRCFLRAPFCLACRRLPCCRCPRAVRAWQRSVLSSVAVVPAVAFSGGRLRAVRWCKCTCSRPLPPSYLRCRLADSPLRLRSPLRLGLAWPPPLR